MLWFRNVRKGDFSPQRDRQYAQQHLTEAEEYPQGHLRPET